MQPNTLPNAATPSVPAEREERIRHLPPEAREGFQRFQSTGDPVTLDPVIFAILADFIPRPPAKPLAELPGTTRLVDDLGFDSLAIIEAVFYFEDLFGITIANQDIIHVHTLDDLRSYLRGKVTTGTKH